MVEQDTEFITFDGDTITKSDYRNDLIDHYIQSRYEGLTKITDFTVGSEAYHLADLMASLMLEKREDTDLNYRMSMIHYAEGEFLDNFGDRAGVHREQSSPSTGEVTFTLDSPKDSIVIIPADTVVATDDAISFILIDDVNIYPGDTSANGTVLCEQEGEYTNVLPGTVNIIISELDINGLSVSNAGYFTDGSDIEEDDEYRARILAAPGNAPTASLPWFENVAMNDENVASSVHDVLALKNVTGFSEDMVLYFHPRDLTDTITVDGETVLRAYQDLVDLFNQALYDLVGVSIAFEAGTPVTVLPASTTIEGDSIEYVYGLVLESDVLLADVKDAVSAVILDFSNDAYLANSFSISALIAKIEDEVDGVFRAYIYEHNLTDSEYTQLSDFNYQVTLADDEYYSIDMTNIASRIIDVQL